MNKELKELAKDIAMTGCQGVASKELAPTFKNIINECKAYSIYLIKVKGLDASQVAKAHRIAITSVKDAFMKTCLKEVFGTVEEITNS